MSRVVAAAASIKATASNAGLAVSAIRYGFRGNGNPASGHPRCAGNCVIEKPTAKLTCQYSIGQRTPRSAVPSHIMGTMSTFDGAEKILVVDDEEAIREVISTLLMA